MSTCNGEAIIFSIGLREILYFLEMAQAVLIENGFRIKTSYFKNDL